MKEVVRACRDCKKRDDVQLKSEKSGIQSVFTRGPNNNTYKQVQDPCEVCGYEKSLLKE